MKIKSDDVIIYPTDTVWGIGSSIYSEEAYNKIAQIKKTTTDKPLSIMFGSIEEIAEYFNCPLKMTPSWLKEFFLLETTLGLPKKLLKKSLPHWIVDKSEYVTIRFVKNEALTKIYSDLKSPFFTTSLNLTGAPAIIEKSEALIFQKENAPNALFIANSDDNKLSGFSSSIIFIDENLKIDVIRKGSRFTEVQQKLIFG